MFVCHPLFVENTRIGCYLPYQDEFDSAPIVEAVCKAKKNCYLPVLQSNGEKILYFVRYQEGDPLRLNRHFILEPEKIDDKISPADLELVLAPLIAFDSSGHRLGTGGGYYDRTFAFIRERSHQRPLLIGLAYQDQKVKALPSDSWDILLDGIITEQEVVLFARDAV